MNAPLYFNKRTSSDLLWFADQVEKLEGVRFLETEEWFACDADLEIWGDASAVGLAFWAPSLNISHIADPVVDSERNFNIFFNEALVILAGLQWASTLNPIPRRVAIHTNSTTSFSIFNSLRALNLYNPILMTAIKICIQHNIDLHIFHIEGKKNTVVDALSCQALSLARSLVPGLIICHFMPPLNMTGANSK